MKNRHKEVTDSSVLPADNAKDSNGSLLGKMSRRDFGKLFGTQVMLASTVTLSGCLGESDDDNDGSDPAVTDPGTQTLSRAEFVATISNYFDWTHSSEYIDQFKSVQPTFADVSLGVTPYAKQIETALEASLIDNNQGYFYPDRPISREDAADIYAKAFLITATANALNGFADADSIDTSKRDSVNAMVGMGFMQGTTATQFDPQGPLTGNEAKTILETITSTMVAPVQCMPKPGTTSPRRYVSYTTPTEGATIYITSTRDGSEPADPIASGVEYNFVTDGVRQYTVGNGGGNSGANMNVPSPSGTIRVKAVAMKDGMAISGVQSFTWYFNRPLEATQPFEYKLVHAPTATSPAVWKIYNMSESVQAFSFFILGPDRGIIFDFLQVAAANGNMKPVVDALAGGKPYDAVLGHNHVDHVAQIGNFSSTFNPGQGVTDVNGGQIYASALDIAQLKASSNVSYQAAGNEAVALDDGHVFDLGGGIKVTAWHMPGHEDGLVTLVTNNGWVYASDMWACNRPYTADTTNYSGVRSDLFLSLTRQLLVNYKKSTIYGQILECTNAHQEAPVRMEGMNNFVKCFQQMIDDGPTVTEGSIRGGANRMSMVHNGQSNVKGMWRDRNWMAVEIGGNPSPSVHKDFTTFTEGASSVMTGIGLAYPCNNTINYNTEEGYLKYSVLSNLEIEGGELIGVDVFWNTDQSNTAGAVPRKLSNKFDPWTYGYTIKVPTGTNSITITPWAMSSKFRSMIVNGTQVAQGASTPVAVANGTAVTVNVVSPDASQTSTYTFTVQIV